MLDEVVREAARKTFNALAFVGAVFFVAGLVVGVGLMLLLPVH